MGAVVNIQEAKAQLSRLVEEAAAGREIVIAKSGRPIARLVALEPAVKLKKFGSLKGRFTVPEAEAFNRALPDAVRAAFGGASKP